MASLPLTIPASTQDTRWKALLDPVLGNPLVNGQMLQNLSLTGGTPNTINHGLGRALQGYVVLLSSTAATFHDNQSTNSMTNLTLILVPSATTTVSLYVF